MSHYCREIYWACYQHRKSQSLGANGRCFAYCGIFSYCALSRLTGVGRRHARLLCSLSSKLHESRVASSFLLAQAGAAQSPEHPSSSQKSFVFRCWCP